MNFRLFFLVVILPFNLFSQNLTNDTINQLDTLGKRQGYWIKLNEEGKKRYEGCFSDNIPVGEFKYYYPNEKLKTVSIFSKGGNEAITISYFETGSKKAEGSYLYTKKEGVWKYYNEEEVLISEDIYLKNLKNGVCKTFYPEGGMSEEIEWENGVKNGIWRQYYTDGTMKLKTQFINDKLEGLCQFFYLSGTVNISGTYIQSVKEGVWMYFKENGKTEKKQIFHEGRLVKEEVFLHVEKVINSYDITTIAYIYYKDSKMNLCFTNGERIIIDERIKELELILDYTKFVKINNVFITSFNAIQEVKDYPDDKLILILEPPCEMEAIVNKDVAEIFKHYKKQ